MTSKDLAVEPGQVQLLFAAARVAVGSARLPPRFYLFGFWSELVTLWRGGVAEAPKLGCHNLITIGKRRDLFAKHVRRRGKTEQSQNRGVLRASCFAVGHAMTADLDASIVDHIDLHSLVLPGKWNTANVVASM